ncbi:MAG: nucleotidyltransferase domain-containing protein [Albidovulum sp.]|nr:nucleotidyltransferase domain-containing protein [Albidovulum sp.]
MHAEIADRKDEIAGICRRYRVSRLEVFGSAARGTDFDPESSDVDFLVEFEPPTLPGPFRRFMGLNRELRTALGRKVDLLTVRSIRNRYLQEAIDRSRELVYPA